MQSSENTPISTHVATKGFDLSAGKTWVYPENYPVRDYQFNIVQACLYNNTLVCLPTGLGKTFIAAVVMYNFWRWYPCGKIVFLAPTRPLVAQQIFACHNTMGIPSAETIELTGAVGHKQRDTAWSKKRVIFATPQVFHNDLEKNVVPSDLVKCVVIDEAHKALGKHSYCECVQILSERNKNFRLLALSATPGNKIDNVHEVLQNLLIAHVELRDETSLDIVPYINKRKVDVILVPLNNELSEFKERYIFIMDRHVKILLQHNILRGHTANIAKGRVFHLLKEYQKKTNRAGNYGQIVKTLNILMTMYHAYELMVRDGLRAFHKFYQNHSDKFWMNEESQLQTLLEDIGTYLGPFPDIQTLREAVAVDIPKDLVFGHTKFEKLKELLLHHFKNSIERQNDTRAIVFVEYRDIVSEIFVLLLQCQPLIRPQMFVGQAGQKQKQQIKALDNFRNNHVNVLISTSIGEEGLDVGEVDLIICFDVSQHSPTRLVQRMGRTGRKRDGHIIILVTDGREHETLKSTMARRDSLNHKVLNTGNISSSFYRNNPRMIPDIFTPECLKMYINVQPKTLVIKHKNGRGKLDKKETKRQNTVKGVAETKSDVKSQMDGNKFPMMKYLKGGQPKGNVENNLQVFTSEAIKKNNVRNSIKPSDVRILSRDNDAVDFLTACALKNSETESNMTDKCQIDDSHVFHFSYSTNFFSFSIPDIEILNCLNGLNDIVAPSKCNENKSDGEREGDDSDRENNDWNDSYVGECVFENHMASIADEYIDGVSKFEKLLDDSSTSSETDLLDNERRKRGNSNDAGYSVRSPLMSNDLPTDNGELVVVGTGNKVNTLQDLEPGLFEDILNETSDDSEISNAENIEQTGTRNEGTGNDVQMKSAFDSIRMDDTVKPEMIKVNEGTSENDNTRAFSEYKDRDTFITVTQAIDEVARLNSNSSVSKMIDESEDDMFEDEWFLSEIDKQSNFHQQIYGLTEREDQRNADKMGHSSDEKSGIGTEFQIEGYEWDDDFEISLDPVESYRKFEVSAEKQASKRFVQMDSNVEKCFSDNKDWVSVKKSVDTVKENAPCTSIAKKLANVRKGRNLKHDYAGKCLGDNDESMNDNRPSMQQRGGKIDDCFLDISDGNFDKKSNDRLFGREYESGRKTARYSSKHNRGGKLRKGKNEFIDDEAQVSSDLDTTDGSSGSDADLAEFVSYTQNMHDTSDMHAHYLQTVKSPTKRQHGFVFKRPCTLDSDVQIYSQPVTQADQSYINDSFCVTGDEDQEITRNEELSELEKIEEELEERRKRKRTRLKESSRNTKRIKRRNIITYFNGESSEDETEKLRKQINDESLLSKQS